MRYLEGLEQQLVILEDYSAEFDSDPKSVEEELLACANCYSLKIFCECDKKVYWPVQSVILKIRWLLQHRRAL